MTKRIRDFAAEYARRVAKGKASGKSRKEARGHLRSEGPQRAKGGKAKRTGPFGAQNTQRFHSLDKAADFASKLPPRSKSFIMGRGTFRNPVKYDQGAAGWADVSGGYALPDQYDTLTEDQIRSEVAGRFADTPKTFEVRWREF